jgi:DNA-binding response OmpR family regulator
MTGATLAGCRVLVVEDEVLVAMLLETALEDENCTIVGPCAALSEALEAARGETLDVALLDINLNGELVFPVAEVLAERGVPFLLLSGYGEVALPSNRRHWPICTKPFNLHDLMTVLSDLVAAPRPQGGGGVPTGA